MDVHPPEVIRYGGRAEEEAGGQGGGEDTAHNTAETAAVLRECLYPPHTALDAADDALPERPHHPPLAPPPPLLRVRPGETADQV